jgi:hypothetical protein
VITCIDIVDNERVCFGAILEYHGVGMVVSVVYCGRLFTYCMGTLESEKVSECGCEEVVMFAGCCLLDAVSE